MKKIKLFLAGAAVLAIVGAGLAFKVKGGQPIWSGPGCPLVVQTADNVALFHEDQAFSLTNATIIAPANGGLCTTTVFFDDQP